MFPLGFARCSLSLIAAAIKCPSKNSKCCTYARWFARPPDKHARSLSEVAISAACMKGLLRFRMGCHHLPRDEGSWTRACIRGILGDERHLDFECPELQGFKEQWSHLLQGPQTMQAFMWQEDLIGVAKLSRRA